MKVRLLDFVITVSDYVPSCDGGHRLCPKSSYCIFIRSIRISSDIIVTASDSDVDDTSSDGGRHGWTKIIRHGWIRCYFNEIDNFIKSVDPLLVFDCTTDAATTDAATTVPVLLSVEARLVVVHTL